MQMDNYMEQSPLRINPPNLNQKTETELPCHYARNGIPNLKSFMKKTTDFNGSLVNSIRNLRRKQCQFSTNFSAGPVPRREHFPNHL